MTEIQFPYTDPVVHDGPVEAPPGRIYVPPFDSYQPDTEPGNPLPDEEPAAAEEEAPAVEEAPARTGRHRGEPSESGG